MRLSLRQIVEEADAGYPGSTGGETLGSIFERDSTEGEDVSRRGERTRSLKRFESLAGSDELACHRLLKDRAEEEDVCLVAPRLLDFCQTVARDRDHRPGQAARLVNLTNLRRGELAGGRGEMNSMCAGGDGNVETGVDQESGPGAVEPLKHAAGKVSQEPRADVFLAKLNEIDPFSGPERSLLDESGSLPVVGAGKQGAAGDRITAHRVSV